jgi:hypothetical protein
MLLLKDLWVLSVIFSVAHCGVLNDLVKGNVNSLSNLVAPNLLGRSRRSLEEVRSSFRLFLGNSLCIPFRSLWHFLLSRTLTKGKEN